MKKKILIAASSRPIDFSELPVSILEAGKSVERLAFTLKKAIKEDSVHVHKSKYHN